MVSLEEAKMYLQWPHKHPLVCKVGKDKVYLEITKGTLNGLLAWNEIQKLDCGSVVYSNFPLDYIEYEVVIDICRLFHFLVHRDDPTTGNTVRSETEGTAVAAQSSLVHKDLAPTNPDHIPST